MKYLFLSLSISFSIYSFAQKITFSEPVKDNSQDMNFEVIGKMKGNVLVFKNLKSDYSIDIYDNEMQLKDDVKLDFLPDKTFNVNFIAYPDSVYLIYQYQKKSVVHCMAVKLNADAKQMGEAIELDTTKIGWLADNKVYTTITSDDKHKIMLFKILRNGDDYNFETLLFNNQLKLIHQSREALPFDTRYDMLSDFFVDNEGDFVFAKSTKAGSYDNINEVRLVIKPAMADGFAIKKIDLNNNYLDVVKLKVDNANKHYLLNALYYNHRSGNITGLFCNIWDKQSDSAIVKVLIPFDDSLRQTATTSGSRKIAFNNFLIRNIIVKKDGGFLLTAEDFYAEANRFGTNPWNRMNYLYGNPFMSPYNYYNYYPSDYWNYHPYNSFDNNQFRFYYDNILVLNINKAGKAEWANMIQKDQYADGDDNYLSFLTFNTGGEIHFMFNEMQRRNNLVQDNIITPDGTLTRNPPLKTMDIDYDFMPKFGRQVSARQVIIPCTYKNTICFARIEY